ncbi:type III polyketide synthase [Glaciihabitans arcticus]|uniref:Type III polyketide synthase n=1 Tax=Glaciihabitans arcticus TaxID=2668039 RepID=A0A4Q9GT26_9MICO|nr:3-oxoacyl-[acyl-carrier-protein] synthase III C-terminal domain-containing protein [Glaciihabitans arcticus]TBN58172.1 type III polyketide synthase [Glaciihabitans arcticus]
MSRIVAVAPELPAYSYPQHEITAELVPLLTNGTSHRAVMERTHANSGIGTRHTALPLERYRDLGTFRQTNDIFIEVATDLCSRALTRGLADAGLVASDVDFVIFTSVTGLSAPSIDALLVQRLGLRSDVKRLPSYGLGCMAGAAGISRLHDYLLGHPTGVAVLLSVELCSLTLQRGDESMANFVATGLFGDGAAAVIMVGEDHPKAAGPRVVDTRSATYPDSTDVIGFLVGETGFEIVLSPGVADVIEKHFPEDVAAFLSANALTIDAVDTWVAHPGGPKVLEAFASSLGLPPGELALSWASLERVGNLSSAAVLHVLADTIAAGNAGPTGLLFALGPGVSAEFVLLEWPT